MDPTAAQIVKLEAHASHLLDEFIKLREKYALLAPMLFNEEVVRARGSYKQNRGFKILRQSLFLSCAQDIAKLCFDKHDATPSILKIVSAVQSEQLRNELREKFAKCISPSVEEETDPQILEALASFEAWEESQLRSQFEALCVELMESWTTLSNTEAAKGFLTIRDKVSAHTEVRLRVDQYKPIDISELGIKWKDIAVTLDSMQRLVEVIGLIVRNAGFAWDSLHFNLSNAAKEFWEP
jgi:hypothetical protein